MFPFRFLLEKQNALLFNEDNNIKSCIFVILISKYKLLVFTGLLLVYYINKFLHHTDLCFAPIIWQHMVLKWINLYKVCHGFFGFSMRL